MPPGSLMTDIQNHANLIWSIADLLRGDYKQSEYGKVILPLMVIRRLDCVLEPTKDAVLARSAELQAKGIEQPGAGACCVRSGQQFYNDSALELPQLLGDPPKLPINLRAYIGRLLAARPGRARQVRLRAADRPARARWPALPSDRSQFCDVDLHPDRVSNLEMGYLFEELIRQFAELERDGR